MYPMFLLVLLGGLRRGEVAGLRHDQIDWPDHLVTVTHQIACHNHMQVYKHVKTRQGDRLLTPGSRVLRRSARLRGAARALEPEPNMPMACPFEDAQPGPGRRL